MKNRLPMALAATALLVALLGSTGIAQAATASFALNAGRLLGFKPSKTSKKNTVVVRGANGKIDARSIPAQARGARGVSGPTGPVGPVGPAGPAGAMGATGPAGIDRLDTVRSATFPIAANSYSGFQTIACPAGMYATGGGTFGNLINDRVVVTIPWNVAGGFSGRADSWGGGVVAGAAASSMRVMVLCAPASQGTGPAGLAKPAELPESLR